MSLRSIFARQGNPLLIATLLVSLLMGTLAPAGYMVAPGDDGWPTVSVCPETNGLAKALRAAETARHAAMGHDMGAVEQGAHGSHSDHEASGEPAQDCAFAGSAQLATGSVDLDLLADALGFVMLRALAPRDVLEFEQPSYLRPPLRGPPFPA